MRRLLTLSAGLIVLMGLSLAFTQLSFEWRLRRTYDVEAEIVVIPTGEATIARGRELVQVGLCTECHGSNLAGRISINDPTLGQIYASNLTRGRGGVGQGYSDADWVRAIRHGIGPDGRSLVITPAQFYYYLSDEDLGAIIAYIKSVPPVDKVLPAPKIAPLGRVFITLFNPKDWFPAEKIDHDGRRPPAPERAISVEYGEYLARISNCLVCHQAADISAATGGPLAAWSEADFISLMIIGMTSNGQYVSGELMPWWAIGHNLSEDDLKAMWLYLETLPAPDSGN
ncbi:MAG: cytochrome c [Chloroflexi bacterium]|nr:cytochrome c [Chloroflexota bacterium]MCI0579882.1 cytochrome c [Chloroflexota bacterium]MCI0646163.1 cytochrome c [Chloroflexota bacterium]MCI0729873.1 cytochrome c [Chloroflexota bacterium]